MKNSKRTHFICQLPQEMKDDMEMIKSVCDVNWSLEARTVFKDLIKKFKKEIEQKNKEVKI